MGMGGDRMRNLKLAMKLLALGAAGLVSLGAGLALAQAGGDAGPPPPGKEVYDKTCAACHAAPEAGSRTPPVASLRKMSAETITCGADHRRDEADRRRPDRRAAP